MSTLQLLQAKSGVLAEIPLHSQCKPGCLHCAGRDTDTSSFPACCAAGDVTSAKHGTQLGQQMREPPEFIFGNLSFLRAEKGFL